MLPSASILTNREGAVLRGSTTVLLVDDDDASVRTFAAAFHVAGYHAVAASSGAGALSLSSTNHFDCAVIDIRLGDTCGLDIMEPLRLNATISRFIVISGWLSTADVDRATGLGASDVLEKPLESSRLIAAVDAAMSTLPDRHVCSGGSVTAIRPMSVAARWGSYVLKGCASSSDPNTLAAWANQSAVSYSTLCEVCRLNGLKPLNARDFVRVLRVLRIASLERSAPEMFLALGDRRTLGKLSSRAGVDLSARVATRIVPRFLKSQKFITSDSEAMRVVSNLVCRW